MVALNPVPGVAQFKVFMLQTSVQILNIHHVTCAGDTTAWSIGDLNLMSLTIWNAYNTSLMPHLFSGLSLGDVIAQDLGSVTGASGSHVGSATGGGIGATISQGSAVCVDWLIGRHYRGGHPRTYLPGLTSNDLINGVTLDGTFTAFVDTWAAAMMTNVAATALTRGGTPSLCCVHRLQNKVVLASPLVDNYEGHLTVGRVCSQRKRLQ